MSGILRIVPSGILWIVPLTATPGGAAIMVDVGPDGYITVRIREHVGVAASLAQPALSALVACQLGRALQDASRYARRQTAQQRRRRSI